MEVSLTFEQEFCLTGDAGNAETIPTNGAIVYYFLYSFYPIADVPFLPHIFL